MFVSRKRKIFTPSKAHFRKKSNIATIGMRASEVFITVVKILYFFQRTLPFCNTLCIPANHETETNYNTVIISVLEILRMVK